MLFVHDHESEGGELRRLREERVGADEQRDVAVGGAAADTPTLCGRHAPHQQIDADAERGEKLRGRRSMLACKELGRREDHRLQSSAGHGGSGNERNGRLPGANISLQQPQHRFPRREVSQDPIDCRCLIHSP